MELVYLWVEEYKNIHRQGFNFSPRFHCKYDPDKNELTIDGNEGYIPSFFGENINVTAIVGKNGSGKSSVLEILSLLYLKTKASSWENEENKWNIWLLHYDCNATQKYFIKFFERRKVLTCKLNGEEIELIWKDPNIEQLLYQPSFDLLSSSWLSQLTEHMKDFYTFIYDLDGKPDHLNLFAFPSKKNKNIDIFINERTDLLNMFSTEKSIRHEISEAMKTYKVDFEPTKLWLSIDQDEVLRKMVDSRVKEFWKRTETSMDVKYFYRVFLMLIVSYNTYDPISKEFSLYFIDTKEVNEYLNLKYLESNNNIEKYIMYLNDNIEEFIKIVGRNKSLESILKKGILLNNDVRDLAKFIDVMNKNNLNELPKIITDKSLILQLVNVIPRFFNINIQDDHNIKFCDFSTGEKYLIRFVYNIVYYIKYFSIKNKLINLYIDEFETGLHPRWQKNVFDVLKQILNKIFSQINIKINLLITTHSPFLLSDIPKQNIIFLDTYKEDDKEVKNGDQKAGNCKVVDGLHDKQETFGANIHTLLSDSFFMEDGLMGEFAKGKINEIIDFYKLVKKDRHTDCLTKIYLHSKQKKFWQTQKIIGEEYLKQVIKNHLVEIEKKLLGKDMAKQEEIKRVEAYLESLKK